MEYTNYNTCRTENLFLVSSLNAGVAQSVSELDIVKTCNIDHGNLALFSS